MLTPRASVHGRPQGAECLPWVCAGLSLTPHRTLPRWYPIEHRLFSQVKSSFSGVILDSPYPALQVIQHTRTLIGFTVKARLLDAVYERGRKCSATFDATKDNFNSP